MNEWTNEKTNEQTNEQMNERTNTQKQNYKKMLLQDMVMHLIKLLQVITKQFLKK